jgi:hypothetical protein
MSRSLPAILALALLVPGGLAAQDPDSAAVDTAGVAPSRLPDVDQDVVDTTALPVSPGGAMIRSMILPGWGQAEFQAYFRGGVYFAAWAGNWFMLFRNEYRLDYVRQQYDIRYDQIRTGLLANSDNPDSLAAQLDSFPDLMDTAVREDSLGNDLRKLVRARKQQREDWIAWSLFWLLASGIDAFVTAHLYDFPAEVDLRPAGGRAAALTVSVPFSVPGGRAPPPTASALPPPGPPRGPPLSPRRPTPDEGMPDSR